MRGKPLQPADLVEHDCILRSGRLLQVLPEWAAPRLPIHAVMSSRLQPASVRARLDFLAAKLGAA